MKKISIFVFFLILGFNLAGCGGGGSDPSSAGNPVTGGDTGTGNTGFSIKGSLAVPGASGAPGLLGAPAVVDSTVTHVIAVSPTSQKATRTIAPVGSDGSFTLDVDPHRPYVIAFIDNFRTGVDKIVGAFKSGALDSIAPLKETGETDLGSLTVTSDGVIGSISFADLLAALGLSSEGATALGEQDDISLRYLNPDIDGDGILDAEQLDRNFMLDFHVRYDMEITPGVRAPVESIIGAYLPDTVGVRYTGTGIYVAVPVEFYSGSYDGATVTLGNLPPITTNITGPGFGNYRSLGPNWIPGSDIPQGTYLFTFGDKTLTFTNVVTRTDAQFTAATGIIMPFIRFNQTDPACVISSGACTLVSVDYKWMKRTDSRWIPATLEELKLFVSDGSGYISVVSPSGYTGPRIGIPIPMTSVDGTIAWKAENAHLGDGITAAEMEATPSSEICNLGLSYDDKLGMRIFSGFENAATCPGI
ncbi:MAG TPA: hypothetical protein VI382_02580 [Candidatus Manganitrophaceae bacterium]|nr:hypothetical protein [Candidatus Manganitrophaceae bacterium]